MCPVEPLLLSNGVKACWVEPILSDTGQVLGGIMLCFREPRSPQNHELEFVTAAAELTSTILDRKRSSKSAIGFSICP